MTSAQPNPVIPSRYAEALGEQDPIEALRKAPKRVKKLVRDLSEKQLSKRPAEGKWSIKEVIAHLADGEVIIGSRLRFAAAMDRATLTSWDEKLFAERLGVERARTKDLLASFADVRAANIELLERLDESALDRVAIHAERGPESVRTMVAMYAGHDVIHERQIERVLEFLSASKSEKKARKKAEEERARQEQALANAAKKARKAEKKTARAEPAAPKKDKKSKSRPAPVAV